MIADSFTDSGGLFHGSPISRDLPKKHKVSFKMKLRRQTSDISSHRSTSKEISDLEGELSSIRNLLSTQATLIHGLANGVNIDDDKGFDESLGNGLLNFEDNYLSDQEKWATEFPDQLDALLAERRVDEALAAFDEREILISQAKEKHTLSSSVLSSLQFAISERKQKLADQLAKAACQPSTRGGELRSAITALKRLGDGP